MSRQRSRSRHSEEDDVVVMNKNSLVQPWMLIESLLRLHRLQPQRADHEAEEVFNYIEQFYLKLDTGRERANLKVEVRDKLECAADADLIGKRHSGRYYAYNAREEAEHRACSAEIMFWALYQQRSGMPKSKGEPGRKKKLLIPKIKKRKPWSD